MFARNNREIKQTVLTAGILVLTILVSSCRQTAASNNMSPAVASANMTQQQMVGAIAPDFQLNDLNGKQVVLSSFQGKPILLVFWTAGSADAQTEMPVIQQLYRDWQSKGLVVLTVAGMNSNPDDTEANLRSFMSKNNYLFPVSLDPMQVATIQFHVADIPTNVLIDKNGVMRAIIPGPFTNESAAEASLTAIMPH